VLAVTLMGSVSDGSPPGCSGVSLSTVCLLSGRRTAAT
jgi:hypothetical protein